MDVDAAASQGEEVAADEDIEEDDEEGDADFVVKCQGCGAKEDDGKEGTLWVQCAGCLVWMHGRCVGRADYILN